MTEELVAEQQPQDAAPPPAQVPAQTNGALREVAGKIQIGSTGLAPKTMGELIDFAQLMAKGGPMIGKAFRGNPGACLGIAMVAMRWRMDPFAVSQKAYVTVDKSGAEAIAYEAQLVAAVINANAPTVERLRYAFEGAGPQRVCVVSATLRGDSAPSEYRSPPLSQISAGGRSPLWQKDPDQQMAYYSVRAWARRYTPDVIMGVYTPDEMEEAQTVTVERSEPIANADGIDQRPPEEIAPPRPFIRGKEKNELVAELTAEMAAARSDGELTEIWESIEREYYNDSFKRISHLVFSGLEHVRDEHEERIANENLDRASAREIPQ